MIYTLQIEEKGFKGFAKVEIPKFSERMKILKETEIKNGEKLEDIDKATALVNVCSVHCKEIELNHEEAGIDIKSVETLEMYQDGLAVIYLIAGVVLNGIPLGNSLKK